MDLRAVVTSVGLCSRTFRIALLQLEGIEWNLNWNAQIIRVLYIIASKRVQVGEENIREVCVVGSVMRPLLFF